MSTVWIRVTYAAALALLLSLTVVFGIAMASPGLQPLDFAGRFARFAVCFIGLILALFLGIWRLTEWRAPQRRVLAPQAPQPGFAQPPMQPQPQYPSQPAMAAAMPGGASQWAPPP